MRASVAALIALVAALAAGPAASAHGGEIITKAIEGLAADPVYVDPNAVPTIDPGDAGRLRERIRAAGGRIYLAVLPADAQHELPTANAVLDEIAAAVGGESTFAVLVGGQFRAASVDQPEETRRLQRELIADGSAPAAQRLERFVDGVADARSDAGTGSAALVGVVAGAVFAVAAVALLLALRRRRTPPTRPEAAI